jgi:hypothetical protein
MGSHASAGTWPIPAALRGCFRSTWSTCSFQFVQSTPDLLFGFERPSRPFCLCKRGQPARSLKQGSLKSGADVSSPGVCWSPRKGTPPTGRTTGL